MDDILTILAFAGWFAIGFGCGYKYTKRKTKHIDLSNEEISKLLGWGKDMSHSIDLRPVRAVIAADREKNNVK